MIGLFKKKEQNNKINLSNYFNWIKSLDKQKLELSNQDLDERLSQSKFLAGEKYSIADIATWPWIARHPIHDIGLSKFSHLSRWYLEISKRTAVVKGFKFMNKEIEIPLP